MLNLTKNDGKLIKSFDNYKELYLHINHIENMKILQGHPQFGQSTWSFMVLSPIRVRELENTLQKEYDREVLARAIKEGSGIIEMCLGDIKNPHLIIDSPGVDVEGFRKDFCDDYCDAHEMAIAECDEGTEP
jgi:hypothetical protein